MIVDLLLLVADLLEALEILVELFLRQDETELRETLLKRVSARVLAENDLRRLFAYVLRRDYLVGLLRGEDAVLMDSRLVQEGVLSHNRLVQRRGLTDNVVHHLADTPYPRRVYPCVGVVESLSRPQCHHELLERRVSGALAYAVHRVLNLSSPSKDACEGIRGRTAEIIVTVHRQNGVPEIDMISQILHTEAHLVGRSVTDSVRDVYRCGSGSDRRLNHSREKFRVASRRVFG